MREKLAALDAREQELVRDLSDLDRRWGNRTADSTEFDRKIDVAGAEMIAIEIEINRTPEENSGRLRARLNEIRQERTLYVDVLCPAVVGDLRAIEAEIREVREKKSTTAANIDQNKHFLDDILRKAETARSNLNFHCDGR